MHVIVFYLVIGCMAATIGWHNASPSACMLAQPNSKAIQTQCVASSAKWGHSLNCDQVIKTQNINKGDFYACQFSFTDHGFPSIRLQHG
jgi:hypothetical protein